MKKYSIIIVFACVCALVIGGVVSFFPPVQSKVQTALRMVQTEMRKLNPPDPYIPTPSVQIDTTKQMSFSSPVPTKEQKHATPSPTLPPPPASGSIGSLHQEFQTWNNCGPATVTMLVRTLGHDMTQADIAAVLKPDSDDKNVNPWEIESFLNQQEGLNGLYRINGDMSILKRFISAGYPVIVETWFERAPNDGMGHYRILRSYDDGAQHVIANDSYEGSNQVFSYDEFDEDWKVYNRTYIIAYSPDQEQEVRTIIGEQMDDDIMLKQAQHKAEQEIKTNEKDAYAWFNLGTVLSKQKKHEEAVIAFDKARSIGLPWRMLWYQFAIFDSYLAVGRYDDVIELTTTNLNQSTDLEESHYYKQKALEAKE